MSMMKMQQTTITMWSFMKKRMTRRQFLWIAAGLGGLAWFGQRTGQSLAEGPPSIFLPLIQNGSAVVPAPGELNASPPAQIQRLIFIHHSTGENWLADDSGKLGIGLKEANYFVSDTNYGWGPNDIGDRTDLGFWHDWFLGPDRDLYMSALYSEEDPHCSYTRLTANPRGENSIILFKSCFPNSAVFGSPNDPPTLGPNPINSKCAGHSSYTVGNIKALYLNLLNYFAIRPDKLFVIILSPPLIEAATNPTQAANARAVNTWLATHLLDSYAGKNVAVFDFYNVLTSNGGSPNTNDAGAVTGNHHRFRNNAVEYITNQGSNFSMYGSGDSHPTAAGGQKATAEFVPLLNIAYQRWKGG